MTAMSVSRRAERGGKWEVRWREGGRRRARMFARKRDAETFADQQRRRIALGGPGPDAGRQTVAEFVEEWWRVHALVNLEVRTRAVYAIVWERHARRRVGFYELRAFSPRVVAKLRSDLESAGVGDPTIIKTMTMLQSVLRLAVTWDLVASNPVAQVRKPRQRRTREVLPVPPEVVEELRLELLRHGRQRDATIISVLAYAGLRPSEALALEWGDVGRTLRVWAPKTRSERFVRVLAPLAADLAEWRLAQGRPPARAPVFARRDGRALGESDYRNWRARVYQRHAPTVGLDGSRPYDLRGSFVSLLVWEGRNVLEVAEQAGHSPQTCLRDYARILAEDEPGQRVTAEERIRRARDRGQRRAM